MIKKAKSLMRFKSKRFQPKSHHQGIDTYLVTIIITYMKKITRFWLAESSAVKE